MERCDGQSASDRATSAPWDGSYANLNTRYWVYSAYSLLSFNGGVNPCIRFPSTVLYTV